MPADSDLLYALAKASRGPDLTLVRELTPSDLELLAERPQSETPVIQRLRHSHHLIARLLAEGRRPLEVASITGYSPSRISMLQGDPAFRDLIAYYGEQVEARYLSVHDRLASLGTDSIEELQERLDSDPGSFSKTDLMNLAELTLDRSIAPKKGGGFGPQSPGAQNSAPQITIQFVEPKGPVAVGVESSEPLVIEQKP